MYPKIKIGCLIPLFRSVIPSSRIATANASTPILFNSFAIGTAPCPYPSALITGLLGEGLSVHEAAVHGVYLHGLAGDHAKHDLGAYSMIASDIIAHIKDVTGGNYEPVL